MTEAVKEGLFGRIKLTDLLEVDTGNGEIYGFSLQAMP